MKGWPKTFDLPKAQWATAEIQDKIEAELRNHFDPNEAKRLASDLVQNSKTLQQALESESYAKFAMREASEAGLSGAAIVVPLEIAAQLIGTSQLDWQRVVGVGVLGGGSAVGGSLAGNATTWLLMRNEVGSASTTAAKIMGLGTANRFANLAGGTVAGGFATVFFSYGGWALGYYDLKTANRSAVAGSIGSTAGRLYVAYGGTEGASEAAAESGVLAVEAETGTELSELGPVEWIAAGITLAVTAPVMYAFHAFDEHEDNIRLSKTIEYLSSKPTFFIPDAQNYGVMR
jgi:hypothetical protein